MVELSLTNGCDVLLFFFSWLLLKIGIVVIVIMSGTANIASMNSTLVLVDVHV